MGGGGAHILSVAKRSRLVQEERKGSQQSFLCATGPKVHQRSRQGRHAIRDLGGAGEGR